MIIKAAFTFSERTLVWSRRTTDSTDIQRYWSAVESLEFEYVDLDDLNWDEQAAEIMQAIKGARNNGAVSVQILFKGETADETA